VSAGLLNVVVAFLVLWVDPPVAMAASTPDTPLARNVGLYRLLTATALLTGAASFVYEVAWIRMLSMALGSSTHAFELMLSAFILGLACGGLWIRTGADKLSQPLQYLGYITVRMGQW